MSNNNFKKHSSKYDKAIDVMVRLVERDHGGCDDDQCSIRNLLDDVDSSAEEIVYYWACSGASDEEFDKLYNQYANEIEQTVRNGK